MLRLAGRAGGARSSVPGRGMPMPTSNTSGAPVGDLAQDGRRRRPGRPCRRSHRARTTCRPWASAGRFGPALPHPARRQGKRPASRFRSPCARTVRASAEGVGALLAGAIVYIFEPEEAAPGDQRRRFPLPRSDRLGRRRPPNIWRIAPYEMQAVQIMIEQQIGGQLRALMQASVNAITCSRITASTSIRQARRTRYFANLASATTGSETIHADLRLSQPGKGTLSQPFGAAGVLAAAKVVSCSSCGGACNLC